ncbi:hypothetical protein ABZ252_34365 [Streptomyces sp. NPDC006175]|uniref:hypothetical protein n=1 Tax=Streptomyces sp. NPDC006175 TaxID=3154471 RepID=UPI0033B644F4
MLLIGWSVLTGVERWAERVPWPGAALGGLVWACVVAGVWWFAEWTQSPLRTARQAAAAREPAAAPGPDDEAPHEPDTATDTGTGTGTGTDGEQVVAGRPGSSALPRR